MTSRIPPAIHRQRVHPPAPTKDLSAHVNDALEHLVCAERSIEQVIAHAQVKDIAQLRPRMRAVHRERDRLLKFAVARDVPLRTLKRHAS